MNPKNFDKEYAASVCVNVHGFIPYFYALPLTEYFCDDEACFQTFLAMKEDLLDLLNDSISTSILQDLTLVNVHEFIVAGHCPVIRVEGVQLHEIQNSIFDFPACKARNPKSMVLKISVALPM